MATTLFVHEMFGVDDRRSWLIDASFCVLHLRVPAAH